MSGSINFNTTMQTPMGQSQRAPRIGEALGNILQTAEAPLGDRMQIRDFHNNRYESNRSSENGVPTTSLLAYLLGGFLNLLFGRDNPTVVNARPGDDAAGRAVPTGAAAGELAPGSNPAVIAPAAGQHNTEV